MRVTVASAALSIVSANRSYRLAGAHVSRSIRTGIARHLRIRPCVGMRAERHAPVRRGPAGFFRGTGFMPQIMALLAVVRGRVVAVLREHLAGWALRCSGVRAGRRAGAREQKDESGGGENEFHALAHSRKPRGARATDRRTGARRTRSATTTSGSRHSRGRRNAPPNREASASASELNRIAEPQRLGFCTDSFGYADVDRASARLSTEVGLRSQRCVQ